MYRRPEENPAEAERRATVASPEAGSCAYPSMADMTYRKISEPTEAKIAAAGAYLSESGFFQPAKQVTI
jgi:hypothetical protein